MQWQIKIVPASGGGITYEPLNLTGVEVGDEVFWRNNDSKPHWPGVVNYPTYFMPNQIAPGSSSSAWVPDAGTIGQTISYVDNPGTGSGSGPTGTVTVSTQ